MHMLPATRQTLFLILLLGLSGAAHAHPQEWAHLDFASGLGHPLSGLDHLLAMFAVGLWAAQQGGAALWRVPLSFVLLMAVGGVLAWMGVPLPMMEPGIAASVLVLGLLVALAARLSLPASLLLVGGFALCHGYAHGAEMASDISLLRYGLGVLLATAALHAAGIGCARVLRQSLALRLGGAAIAASGFLLLTA